MSGKLSSSNVDYSSTSSLFFEISANSENCSTYYSLLTEDIGGWLGPVTILVEEHLIKYPLLSLPNTKIVIVILGNF
jgi:hypothetical protein